MTKRFHYGGQAVIEGVMMRGQKVVVTVVRRPDGELVIDTQPLATIYTGWMKKAPLIRGIITLIEAIAVGIRALLYSVNVSLEAEEEKISGGLIWAMVLFSVALAVGLFFLAPLFLTKLLDPYIHSPLVFHLTEGFIRLAIFITYLKLITLIPDIKRVFAYHGAEHKTVNAYEAGAPLEVVTVKGYSIAHVRCGTSFLFAVLIIAILVFAFIGRPPSLWLMVLSRVILIPVIAALGYEVTHFGGKYSKNSLISAILYPGLVLQRLTTRQPNDTQLEVAISALNKVVEIEQEVQPTS